MNENYFIKTDRNITTVIVYLIYIISLLSNKEIFTVIYPLHLILSSILFMATLRSTSNRLNFSWKLTDKKEVHLIIFFILFAYVGFVNLSLPFLFFSSRIFTTFGSIPESDINLYFLFLLSSNSLYFIGLVWVNIFKFKKELDTLKYKEEILQIEQLYQRKIISENSYQSTLATKKTLYCYGKMKISRDYSLLLNDFKNGIITKDIFEQSKSSILDEFIRDMD
jgi:hypothetical protein